MSFSLPRAAAFLVTTLLFAGCSRPSGAHKAVAASEEGPSVKPEHSRNPAPDFNLKDANGQPVKLSDYKGKVVLLNFWATWCGPCKLEIPWFVEFQRTYKDKGFSVIGVSLDEEGWEIVRPYISARQVNYPVVVGDVVTEQKYGGIESLPTTFIIDRQGRIASVHIGLISKKVYEDDIKLLVD